MSEELLEIVKPIIEPQILLREQSALEKGMEKVLEELSIYCGISVTEILR